MNIKSLSYKNIVKDENGEEYFDLSVPSFNFTTLQLKAIHFVLSDEVGRLDKILNRYYSKTDYFDAVCVINGIFNPFAINEGDVIIIPDVQTLEDSLWKTPDVIQEVQEYKKSIQVIKNDHDTNRLAQINKNKTPHKPNELTENQSVKKYINGKVILGTNLNIKSK